MRLTIGCLVGCLLLASSAHAITKEQGQRIMDGEDINDVVTRKPQQVTLNECHYTAQCNHDEYCHKERDSDPKGVCVKKKKD